MSSSAALISRLSCLVVRLRETRLAAYVADRGHILFSKYLFLTNMGIGMASAAVGDGIQQKYEMSCNARTKYDAWRTLRITSTSLICMPVAHYWYLYLDVFFPGRTVRTLAIKLAFDQIIYSPINISLFMFALGKLEGHSNKKIIDDTWNLGKKIFAAECLVWSPGQLANFYYVPTRFRIAVDSLLCLGFDFYYSHVRYGENQTIDEGKQKAD